MDRRSFLRRLVSGAAVATATTLVGLPALDLEAFVEDPERLLWVPGQKTFFLPPTESLISGDEALTGWKAIQQQSIHEILKGQFREIKVRRGTILFDSAWNIVAFNGRRVSAREATELRQESFAPWGGKWKDPNVTVTEAEILAARVDAGLKEPKQHHSYVRVDEKDIAYRGRPIQGAAPFRIIDDEPPPWRPGEEPWSTRGRRKVGALKPHNPHEERARRIGAKLIQSDEW